jgi:drug/metabolite transporter (DMT)-like permease
MTITSRHKGILFVAIGAICFSAKAIMIKLAYKNFDVDDLTLLSLRFGFSLPFFLGIAIYRAQKGKFKALEKIDWWYIAGLSLLGYYIASWLDFKGLKYVTAGVERIILFIYPTFAVVFSNIFLKKKITRPTLYALLLTYAGILCIAAEPRIFQSANFWIGSTLIAISALTYALYLVFGGELINKYGSANFNSIAMVFSSIYVLIHFGLFSNSSLLHLEFGLYAFGFALAIISTVLPTFIVMEGIKLLGANTGAIVSSIGPVSTIILAYFILGESLSIQEVIGSIMVLFGVLLLGK